ncbi:hypothetical protein BC834DRAFT_301235 [Gloeopeniophorella convolvens]|nr:hypothetical protein BC834DRAFT_301235 [Gloeopeniophorella convolvens]
MSDDTLVLRKYMKNVGRAYRKQAVTFIRFCRGLNAEIHSGGNANDRALRDALLLVDQALDAVVKAGTGTSAEADSALASAQEALEKFGHVLGLKDKAEEFGKELNGARDKDKKTTTAIAKIKESIGVTPGSGLKRGKVMKLDFVLRNESLLPSSKDLIVHRIRSSRPGRCNPVELQSL